MYWDMTMTVTLSNGETGQHTIDLGNFTDPATELADVQNAANQISTTYNTITRGVVSDVVIKTRIFNDNSLPTENAELWDKASLSLFLEDRAGEKSNRTAGFNVVAPVDGIFLDTQGAGYDIVDTNDADLVNFVQQLGQHARIAKVEKVDLTKNDGIRSGERIGRNTRKS